MRKKIDTLAKEDPGTIYTRPKNSLWEAAIFINDKLYITSGSNKQAAILSLEHKTQAAIGRPSVIT